MAGKLAINLSPIVSEAYCSPLDVMLVVRRRPKVVNGGGFVVLESNQRVVFRVDGCGVLGRKDEVVVGDGFGNALLFIRQNIAMMEALSVTKQWKGFGYDSQKLVFTLRQPSSCFSTNDARVKISIDSRDCCGPRNFEVHGDFPGRHCSIIDSRGDAIAKVGVEGKREDMYQVIIKGGVDQAFVCGVIAVLDYIYDGSTRC